MNSIVYNFIQDQSTKTNYNEDMFSDKSFDEETIPDEDFDLTNNKKRSKLLSCPNVDNNNDIGPNINLKVEHKRYSNQKEKEFFFEKIKRKKKQNYVKIMNYIMTAIIKIIVVLLMVLMN